MYTIKLEYKNGKIGEILIHVDKSEKGLPLTFKCYEDALVFRAALKETWGYLQLKEVIAVPYQINS